MSENRRRANAVFLGFLILLTGVPLASIASVNAAPIILVGNGTNSANWSGYAVTGAAKTITSAQGSWVVPSVTCGSNENSYSSYWVGIDGFTSSTVEQTGTDSDCSHGVPTYYAWIEFFPKPSKVIAVPISPGDVISASVKFKPPATRFGTGTFTLTLQDVTTGQTSTASSSVLGAQRSSAEFIVEAPAICSLLKCTLARLSNFGTANFGSDYTQVGGVNCAVGISGGAPKALGTFGPAIQQITMVSQSNPSVVKAQPLPLSDDGTSFQIQWMSSGP